MSSEIVPADPIQERVDGGEQHERMGTFTRSLTYGSDYVPKLFDSERLPVTLGSEIRKLLRVANQLEFEEPRVAYLCRFHAFEKAHIMDRHSSGRGVRQFKTALLQRLERDMQNTLMKRKEKSDMRELKRVCKEYGDYTERHTKQDDFANREKLRNARTIASVLFDVLNTVSSAAGHQVLADRDTYYKKTESDVYNILPLDHGGTHQAIMKLPQIKIAVAAIRDTCGLPFLEDFQKRRNALDVFDWLQFCFGFQTGNVANQREHLILLLANFRVEQCQRQAYVPQVALYKTGSSTA